MKPLTKSERAVMRLLSSGLSNKATAAALGCHPKTVEKHREAIYYKWSVDSLAALIRVGLRTGELALQEFLASSIGENSQHETPSHLSQ